MPKRALRPCKQPGCRQLVTSGYCEVHASKVPVNTFKRLDDAKTDEDRQFYRSGRWRATSEAIRRDEPLCRECKQKGFVKQAELVHHEPERKELLKMGLDPFDRKYLIPICRDCHQRHLSEKKGKRGVSV